MVPIIIRNKNGFSITELIVVIAIIAIAASIATLDFRSFQTRYGINAQVSEMASDFNDARIASQQKKRWHGINITANSYTFRSYSSVADTSGSVVFTKTLKYGLTKLDGSAWDALLVKFDELGYVNGISPPSMAIGIGAGNSPNDCLVMSISRVNIGKLTGGVCVYK